MPPVLSQKRSSHSHPFMRHAPQQHQFPRENGAHIATRLLRRTRPKKKILKKKGVKDRFTSPSTPGLFAKTKQKQKKRNTQQNETIENTDSNPSASVDD